MWLPTTATYHHRLGLVRVIKAEQTQSERSRSEFADTLWRISDCLTEARLATEQGELQQARVWQARAAWWARASGSPELLRLVGQYAETKHTRTATGTKTRKRTLDST